VARRCLIAFLAAGVVLALSSCGSGGKPRTFVSAAEQRRLPTQQHSAGGELCPDRDQSHRVRREITNRGKLHAKAIITAYKRHPDALVHTTYASSDEGPGSEDITVRALLKQWARDSYCKAGVQAQLRKALAVRDG
jgi:transposase